MTVPWLAVDNSQPPEAVAPPSKFMVAEALWRHGKTDIIDQACPWWLRQELNDIAWAMAPAAVVGLGLPDGLVRFYLAIILAAGIWAALRWPHLQRSLERARRQNTRTAVLAVAEQIATTDPALATHIAVNDKWDLQLARALRASLAAQVH